MWIWHSTDNILFLHCPYSIIFTERILNTTCFIKFVNYTFQNFLSEFHKAFLVTLHWTDQQLKTRLLYWENLKIYNFIRNSFSKNWPQNNSPCMGSRKKGSTLIGALWKFWSGHWSYLGRVVSTWPPSCYANISNMY